MKKFKLFMAVACMMATIGFASCNTNDDNDNRPLSDAEKTQCYNACAGMYSGKLNYALNERDQATGMPKTASKDITWNILSEKRLVISHFPAVSFAYFVANEDIKAALLASDEGGEAQDLECEIEFASMSPIQFQIRPNALTYNLTYGGAEHKVQAIFYVNYPTMGQYTSNNTTRVCELQLFFYGLRVDDQDAQVFSGVSVYLNASK